MAYILSFIVVLAMFYFYKKGSRITLIAAFVLILVLHIFSIIKGHSWGDDFIVYLAQAKSLLHGNINEVISKQQLIQHLSKVKTGPILYPWGYPFFLAAVYNFFGDNYFAYKMINVISICVTGLIIILFLDKNKKTPAIILFLLITLNPFLFDYKNEINADILLMCFTALGILCIKKLTNNWFTTFYLFRAVTAGFIFFLCTFIKAAGVVIIIVFLCSAVLTLIKNKEQKINHNRYLVKNVCFVFATYIFLLIITNQLLPNFIADYINYYNFRNIIKSAPINLIQYAGLFKNFLFNQSNILYALSVLIGFSLFTIGVYFSFKRLYYLILFFFVYMLLLIVTPYSGGVRYLLPLLPFFFLFCFLGIEYLYLRSKNDLSLFGIIVSLFLIFCFIKNDFEYLSEENRMTKINNGAFSPKAKEFYNFLRSNTSSHDTLIFFKPRF